MEPLRDFRAAPDPVERKARIERQIRDMHVAMGMWRSKFSDVPEVLERMEREHATSRLEKEAELAAISRPPQFSLPLGPDEISKAGESGDFYYVALPNSGADFVVEGVQGGATFVEYLRRTFACGGFPGWYLETARPAELDKLSRDLLPL